MSGLIRIRPVSSRSKIDTLREFGHRVFAELGDKGESVGYFVEYKGEGVPAAPVKPTIKRKSPINANQLVIYTGLELRPFKGGPDTPIARVAALLHGFASKPARRGELLEAIIKTTGLSNQQVTNALSALTTEGYLERFEPSK